MQKKIPIAELNGYTLSKGGIMRNEKGKKMKFDDRPPYTQIEINKHRYTLHRLLAITFIPNPENKREVNHKDGNKRNNELSNLEWATTHENRRHAFKTGLQKNKSGSKHWNSKLTQTDVDEIRRLRKETDLKLREIGAKFNISPITVHQLVKFKRWNPVPIPERENYIFKSRKNIQ